MTKEIKSTSIRETVATILAKICYPAADDIGDELAERTKVWRQKNTVSVLEKADKIYDQHAVSGREHAHPRLIHKIVDESSWVEDDLVRSMWAGLIVSSCTDEGTDESNLIFTGLLSDITSLQACIINYAAENAEISLSPGGWVISSDLDVTLDELIEITGVDDVHRLDRELDHLRGLELISQGFYPESQEADISLHSLGIQLYVRCQGYIGNPVDYFGLNDE